MVLITALLLYKFVFIREYKLLLQSGHGEKRTWLVGVQMGFLHTSRPTTTTFQRKREKRKGGENKSDGMGGNWAR